MHGLSTAKNGLNNLLGDNKGRVNADGGVYILKDQNGNVRRTGRTKDLEQRKQQHARAEETKDLDFEEAHRTDNYAEQRGLEHKLYEEHKGTALPANGGLNKSKAIRDNNPNKGAYIKAAAEFLKKK
jgi:predicted GIY-YIG superfamily endonuclease